MEDEIRETLLHVLACFSAVQKILDFDNEPGAYCQCWLSSRMPIGGYGVPTAQTLVGTFQGLSFSSISSENFDPLETSSYVGWAVSGLSPRATGQVWHLSVTQVHEVFYFLHCWFWIQSFSAENNYAKRIEVVHWAVSGHSTSRWAPNPNAQASLQHRNSITLFAPYYLWFLKSIILVQVNTSI